jgi:hypothetical protein
MNALFSGLKDQAMGMVPDLIQNSKVPIESALRDFIAKNKIKNPNAARILSQNLNEINSVVQTEMAKPAALPPPATGGKRRKTRKHKKRTLKRQG